VAAAAAQDIPALLHQHLAVLGVEQAMDILLYMLVVLELLDKATMVVQVIIILTVVAVAVLVQLEEMPPLAATEALVFVAP